MTDVRGSLRFITVLALLSGCSLGAVPGVGAGDGGGDAGSGSGSDDTAASAAFDSMIKPLVTSCTANTVCHGGTPSLQNPVLTSFAGLKMSTMVNPAYLKQPGSMNIFILKAGTLAGANHPPSLPTLAVPYLTTEQQATFTTFIDMYGTP